MVSFFKITNARTPKLHIGNIAVNFKFLRYELFYLG